MTPSGTSSILKHHSHASLCHLLFINTQMSSSSVPILLFFINPAFEPSSRTARGRNYHTHSSFYPPLLIVDGLQLALGDELGDKLSNSLGRTLSQ
jgi:hypothetical protein